MLNVYATSFTTIPVASGSSTFYFIGPIKNQVGLALYTKGVSAGLEIAGGGISYAAAGYTVVNSVTLQISNLNSNGSSIGLVANGSGFPICREAGVWPPCGYLPGAPALWLSAGNSYVVSVLYFTNEAMPNT